MESSFNRLSKSIESLRFPLILFIIMLHCYTSTSSQMSGHGTYFCIIYPLSLWAGETGVPAYFFISGLLLFYSKKSYNQKLISRIKTLLIPYLFFNGMVLVGFLSLMFMGKPAVILDKSLADYNFFDYIRAFWDRGEWSGGNSSPLLCPFWYIRNLMVLVLLSPLLYYIIKYTKLIFPIVMGVLWINCYDSAYTLQSLTMFSLGAFFPINNYNPIPLLNNYKYIFVSAFVVLGIIDFCHNFIYVPYAMQYHRLSLIANVFFLIWIGEHLSKYHLYSSSLSKSAFFVFAIHYPLTLVLRPFFSYINNFTDSILAIVYIVCVGVVTCICVGVYFGLRLIAPRLLSVITGSRS